jgi:hypothetical protein
MLACVALIRTDVSEELRADIIRVKRIGELGTKSGLTINRCAHRGLRRLLVKADFVPSSPDSCHTDEGGATFPRNVGSNNSHTA